MFHELESVILDRDYDELGLKKGDVGAVVHCYADGMAYEVEFVTGEGKTVALLTLPEREIRAMGRSEILRVREYAPA